MLDPPTMIAKARKARALGADIVLGVMHAGDEYASVPNAQQQDVAHALVDSGEFTMIYGHHTHSVLPIEQYKGTWIVYGLGNGVTELSPWYVVNNEGLLVRAQFSQDARRKMGRLGSGLGAVGDSPGPYRWCSVASDAPQGPCAAPQPTPQPGCAPRPSWSPWGRRRRCPRTAHFQGAVTLEGGVFPPAGVPRLWTGAAGAPAGTGGVFRPRSFKAGEKQRGRPVSAWPAGGVFAGKDGVGIVRRAGGEAAVLAFDGGPDEEVREGRVLGQQRAVQIARHDVPVAGPFLAVAAVVAGALGAWFPGVRRRDPVWSGRCGSRSPGSCRTRARTPRRCRSGALRCRASPRPGCRCPE